MALDMHKTNQIMVRYSQLIYTSIHITFDELRKKLFKRFCFIFILLDIPIGIFQIYYDSLIKTDN